MVRKKAIVTGAISSLLAIIMVLMGFMPQVAQAHAIDQRVQWIKTASDSPEIINQSFPHEDSVSNLFQQGTGIDLEALLTATEDPNDTDGEVKVRIDGQYLAQALKACGGMVDFKVTSPLSPMLFSANGYQLVVMPMMTNEASEQSKRDTEAKGEATTTEQAEPTAEVETEPEPTEPVAEPKKARRSRKAKEAVTV